MSDTPVVPTTPVPPDTSVHWGAGREFFGSLGRWCVSFGEVRVGGATRTVFGGLWAAAGWLLGRLHWLILLWAACYYLLSVGAVQLPLPVWPWPTPTPAPVSPLVQSMHAAYLAETDPAKAIKAAKLASLFTQAIPAARADANVKTVADVMAKVHVATGLLVNDPVANTPGVPTLRKAIGVYLDGVLPTTKATPMTDQIWLQAGAEFGRVSDALMKGAK